MYKSFIYFVLFLNLFHSTAQEVNSLWETHFSYYNVNDLESNGPYIYASSDNSIFIYNTQTSELTKITTKQGLAGEAISSIYFSSNHNKLIAGFVNGLIQVIDFNTSNIFSIYDIIDKTTISPDSKRINNFNEFDQHIYISTDYGISIPTAEDYWGDHIDWRNETSGGGISQGWPYPTTWPFAFPISPPKGNAVWPSLPLVLQSGDDFVVDIYLHKQRGLFLQQFEEGDTPTRELLLLSAGNSAATNEISLFSDLFSPDVDNNVIDLQAIPDSRLMKNSTLSRIGNRPGFYH